MAIKLEACRILFTTPRIAQHDNRKLLHDLTENPGPLEGIVILRGYPGPFISYAALVEVGATQSDQLLSEVSTQFDAHDVCNLQFTSGTTGNPKAAMLTHQ